MTELPKLDPSQREYWTALRKVDPPSWPDKDPEPIHSSRDPYPADFVKPRAVTDLEALLLICGFSFTTTYARGFVRMPKIGTYKEVHSLAVRFAGYNAGGFAIYRTPVSSRAWKWEAISVHRSNHFPFTKASVTDLKEWIQVRGNVLPSWYEAIAKKVEAQKEKNKQAAKNRTSTKESGG